jgi:hypothetical protein
VFGEGIAARVHARVRYGGQGDARKGGIFSGMVAAECAETDYARLEKAGLLVFTCEQRNTPWV